LIFEILEIILVKDLMKLGKNTDDSFLFSSISFI